MRANLDLNLFLTQSALSVLVLLGSTLCLAPSAHAGGFELGENTTKAVARGGAGATLTRDPSALYFNPALLPRARGAQLLLDVNIVDMNISFERDPLVYTSRGQQQTRTYDPDTNQSGAFPAPFLAASWDLGIENFALGVGVFGPSAYSGLCYGTKTDNGCELNPDSGARYMMSSSELLQFYLTLGAGYRFKVGNGHLSVGLSMMAAYQQTSFTLLIDETETPVSRPYSEDPETGGLFEAQDISGWKPTGVLGLAYQNGGVHLSLSYRPPINWETTGTVKLALPPGLSQDLGARLSDDEVSMKINQAGSLRLGAAWTEGTHPGFEDRPRLELEANLVWEDWSRTESFEVDTKGEIEVTAVDGIAPIPIATIYQQKSWQDTWSLRMGASYGALPWLTAHAGAFMETATQSSAYTNADFPAWERYGVSTGSTFHVGKWLDVDLGYMFIRSPSRTVTQGNVYQPIPLSACQGPDYTNDACNPKGSPPGNPQNEGTWSFWSQIASVGLTVKL